MKTLARILAFLTLWGSVAGAQTPIVRESVGTSVDTGAALAFDGQINTAWRLSAGETSGWAEASWPVARRISAVSIDADLPSAVRLNVFGLSAQGWISLSGGTISGPISGTTRLALGFDSPAVSKTLVTFSGPTADAVRVWEIAFEDSPIPASFGKILPRSYSFNQGTYVNIKPDRLWDATLRNSWFEPLWSVPSEVNQTDAANKPTAIFPPYSGYPSTSGEIVWELEAPTKVQTLKAYFLALNKSVRFDAWNGSSWTLLGQLDSNAGTGWVVLRLPSEVSTSRVRISFPEGWEKARMIGEVEVWGTGSFGTLARPLVVPAPGADGQTNLVVPETTARKSVVEVRTAGVSSAALTGDWNGVAFSQPPFTWAAGETVYRIPVDATSWNPISLTSAQYLRLASNSVVSATIDGANDRGIVTLEWPFTDGSIDQTGPAGAPAATANRTWPLGQTYTLEKSLFHIGSYANVSLKAGSGSTWTTAILTSLGGGWYQANWNGVSADRLQFESDSAVVVDEVQNFATKTIDTNVVVEVWWPLKGALVTSAANDSNSVIGWVGESEVGVTVAAANPRKQDRLFWMPLKLLGLAPGDDRSLAVHASWATATADTSWNVKWNSDLPHVSFQQNEDFWTTDAPTATFSGTVQNSQSRVFVGGVEVAVVNKAFTKTVTLVDGFQRVRVEVWNNPKTKLQGSMTKPIYKVSGPLSIVLDLPYGDLRSNEASLLVTGRVSGGPNLALTIDGTPVAIANGQFEKTVALSEGNSTVTFVLTDALGRSTTKTLTVWKDSIAPELHVVFPASGALLAQSNVTVRANSGSEANVWWRVGDGAWELSPTTQFERTIALNDGAQSIAVSVKDASGNVRSLLVPIVVDTTPPNAFTVSANVSGWTSNNDPVIAFSTTDATSAVERYELSLDGSSWSAVQSPYAFTDLSDGAHLVVVKAIDVAGNSTIGEVALNVDTTPPAKVENLRGIPGQSQVEVLWTTPDADVVKYHVTRTPAWPEGERIVTEARVGDEGLSIGSIYTYEVWAEDRAGNLGQKIKSADTILGLGLKPISQDPEVPTIVEYDGLKAVVPTGSLPEGNVAVLIKQIDSPELREHSSYPIVSPIYELSTLVQAEDGTLSESTHSEFTKEVVMILDYDASQLPNGFPETNLDVYYWDTTWSKWFKVEKAAVDTVNKKIVFVTNHFTSFSVQPTMVTDLSPQQLKDIGHNPTKAESFEGPVSISAQGGTAMTEVTDFVLPGRNGFSLPIKRIYDSATALSDSPSLSLSASLSFNSVTDLLDAAGVGAQLVSQGVGGLVNAIKSKMVSVVQQSGDYALSTGIGWRLNFPYVTTSNSSVYVRLPNGGYYNINQMKSNQNFWTSNPVNRTLEFEFHEGEDFRFVVHQMRLNASNPLNYFSGQLSSAISGSINSTLFPTPSPLPDATPPPTWEGSGTVSTIRMVASLIPGWVTTESELWLKDGTHYKFDGLGRVIFMEDKTGENTYTFEYSGMMINRITDDLGRSVDFQYNASGATATFLRPVVTKISTQGFQSTVPREVRYDYDFNAGSNIGTFFNFLPKLTKSIDPLGREYLYEYQQNTIVTGGGSIKINIAALLINLIPGIGTQISSSLGISALTLSGHLEINLPFTIHKITAPGIGTTTVFTRAYNLSQFNVTPADYFLGVFPTAIQLTFEIAFRMATESVTVASTNGTSRTTTYEYSWSIGSNFQYFVNHTTIRDGRTRTEVSFDSHYVRRYRYISWDDYLVSVGTSFFQSQPFDLYELFTLMSQSSTFDSVNGQFIESTTNVWDTNSRRVTSSVVTRGATTVSSTNSIYDNWGNPVYKNENRTTNGIQERVETWTSFLQTTSPPLPNGPSENFEGDETLPAHVHDLPKAIAVRIHLPAEVGGGYQDRYRAFAYNTLGLKKSEGLWLGDRWSKTDYEYVTDSSSAAFGAVKKIVGPIAGQETALDYDYSRTGQFYTVRQTVKNVADPLGATSDLVSETAFDWNTGWKIYQKDARGYVTVTKYDVLGRTIEIVKPGDEAPLALGDWNVVKTNAPQDRIVYTDTVSPVASVYKSTFTTGASNALPAIAEKYTYDSLGQLFQIEKYSYKNGALDRNAKTTATYTAWGEVASLTDPNGNTTTYLYEAKGRVKKVTNADGTFQTFVYDDSANKKTTTNERGVVSVEVSNWSGKPIQTIGDFGGIHQTTTTFYNGVGEAVATVDPLGQVMKVTYNAFGKPALTERPSVGVGFDRTAVTPIETATYDDAGRPTTIQSGSAGNLRSVTTVYDHAGRAVKKIQNDRQEWTWYDANGQVVRHADPLAVQKIQAGTLSADDPLGYSRKTYTSRGQVATETDPLGATVKYRYDFKDRKVEMKDPRSTGSGIDSFTIVYQYDDLDRLVGADVPPVLGNARATISFEYDLRGNAVQQIDQLGRVTSWTYDVRNRKTSQSVTGSVPADGSLTSAWGYDAVGNVTKEIVVKTLDASNPANSTGLVTVKLYDALNRLERTQLPDGQSASNVYDTLNRVTAVTSARGFTTVTQYNSLNKPTVVTDAKNGVTRQFYSVWGENVATQLENPATGDQIWTRSFDDFGQLTAETNNAGQSWSYEYDARGLQNKATDPKGIVTVSQYDVAGRIVQKTQTLGAETQTQSWQYDLAGSVKTATDGTVMTSVNTVNGTYLADPYDLVNHYRTVVGGTTLDVAYTYDNAHNVTSVTYPDAFTVSSNYNSLGQLTSIPGFATEGQYNFMGRLTSLAALNGTKREKTWNETTGSLDSYTYNVTGKTPRTLVWNEEGNVDSITKEGKTSTYLYDQLNRLVYSNEQFPAEVKADDTLARGIRKRDVGGIRSLDFNVSTQNVAFDTAATSIGIDLTSAQRINKIRLNAVDSRLNAKTVHVYTSLTGEEKSWTRVDRTTWIADQTGITVQFVQDVTARYVKINSTWDERNADNQTIDHHTVTANAVALLDVYFTVDGQTTSWTYDALGNRLSQDQVKGVQTQTAYTYYPNTNLIKTAGAWSFNYDANQNLTAKGTNGVWNASTNQFDFDANAGEVFTYDWDLLNRLVKVSHSQAGTASLSEVETNVYDIRNLRVAQTKKTVATYYQYDQSGDLLYKESAQAKTKYVQALGQIWAEVRTKGTRIDTYWHHTDYEGSTDTITDFNAKVVWSANYEAFGNVISSNGSLSFDANYTGKEFDADTGLYYFNARWQDPTLGRFISSDPARADGWNWVAFTSNNPLRFVDPTGMYTIVANDNVYIDTESKNITNVSFDLLRAITKYRIASHIRATQPNSSSSLVGNIFPATFGSPYAQKGAHLVDSLLMMNIPLRLPGFSSGTMAKASESLLLDTSLRGVSMEAVKKLGLNSATSGLIGGGVSLSYDYLVNGPEVLNNAKTWQKAASMAAFNMVAPYLSMKLNPAGQFTASRYLLNSFVLSGTLNVAQGSFESLAIDHNDITPQSIFQNFSVGATGDAASRGFGMFVSGLIPNEKIVTRFSWDWIERQWSSSTHNTDLYFNRISKVQGDFEKGLEDISTPFASTIFGKFDWFPSGTQK